MADEFPEVLSVKIETSQPNRGFDYSRMEEEYNPVEFNDIARGIAEIVLPQSIPEVMMMGIPPLTIFNRVSKILRKAGELEAMGKSFIKASGRAYDTKGKNFIQQSKDLKNNIPKKDMDIYDKYLKNQMENPSQKAIDSKANIQKILDKIQ
jgi:hypothetical protein